MRPIVRRAAHFALFLVAVESLFWLFGHLSMQRGNPNRLYDANRLAAETAAILPAERDGSVTGWPRTGEFPMRGHPAIDTPSCGSAWGGSFTFADDVDDDAAWPYRLSTRLRCQIDNHGIDGFGFDQTLLHFRLKPPANSIVILGLTEPMLIVDGVSSLTFLSLHGDNSPQPSLTKPVFRIEDDLLKMVPRPAADIDAITRHFDHDMAARDWTQFTFPFSLHVIGAIDRHFRTTPFTNPSDLIVLNRLGARLITEMARTVQETHNRFVLLLIPSPDTLAINPAFAHLIDPESVHACIVDPTEELKTVAGSGSLRTKTGHFNARGNEALADAMVRGLKTCGIVS